MPLAFLCMPCTAPSLGGTRLVVIVKMFSAPRGHKLAILE